MSFMFGGSSSKTSQNSSGSFTGTDNTQQNSTQTATPNNPDWVTAALNGATSGATGLAGANPQTYVAGPNTLQTQAGAGAGNLSPTPPGYDTAGNFDSWMLDAARAPQTSAQTASPYIANYMNPYMNDVVNASTASFDNQAAQTKAQQALQLAQSGAFGGSGAAIDQALTEGQLGLSRGQLVSGLLNTGYQSAVSNAQQDAQRAQEAADLNANLHANEQSLKAGIANNLASTTSQQGENARQNVATQDAAGGILQQIQQAQASSPLALQSWLQSMLSGLPLNLLHGETDTGQQTGTEEQSGTQQSSGTSKTSGSKFGFGNSGGGGGGSGGMAQMMLAGG